MKNAYEITLNKDTEGQFGLIDLGADEDGLEAFSEFECHDSDGNEIVSVATTKDLETALDICVDVIKYSIIADKI
jgi:hypothetical protein